MDDVTQPVFRFAPSPNGLLHLGHAYSALVNFEMAQAFKGRFLLRLEDIDTVRCTPAYEEQIFEDLAWLGIRWEEPVRRQSDHFETYAEALETLRSQGLIYPATLSRAALKRMIAESEEDGKEWPRDPDGAPLYPTQERHRSHEEQEVITNGNESFAWRLNMVGVKALMKDRLSWTEWRLSEAGEVEEDDITADPWKWGDVVLGRKDIPTSYHLSVVIDDMLQGVTHIVRGQDLKEATAVHRDLLDLLE